MSLSAPTQITVPFASLGAYNTIPANADTTNGLAGYDLGFPPVTMLAKEAGGIPPEGLDFNGIFLAVTQAIRWLEAGGSFPYSSAFSTAVGGYPLGAQVQRSDGSGYWNSLIAANTHDPEASWGYWLPADREGYTPVTMTNANVTLTQLQAAKRTIIITGTLTANLNLYFPAVWEGVDWLIVNNTTGAYTVTAITASGTGVSFSSGQSRSVYCDGTNIVASSTAGVSIAPIQTVSATVASNAMTVTLQPTTLAFRNGTLSSGTPTTASNSAAISVTIPSGATLGMNSGVACQIAVLALNNGGALSLGVVNLTGGSINLSESGLIATTAISSSASSAGVVYSPTSFGAIPYRVVGMLFVSEATAGTWATAPSTIAGIGGLAGTNLAALGVGQTAQALTGSRALSTTFFNTTDRPIFVSVEVTGTGTLIVNGATISHQGISSGANASVSGPVPPYASYSATGGTLVNWYEMR